MIIDEINPDLHVELQQSSSSKSTNLVTGRGYSNFWNDLTFRDMIYISADTDTLHVMVNRKLTITHKFIFYTS